QFFCTVAVMSRSSAKPRESVPFAHTPEPVALPVGGVAGSSETLQAPAMPLTSITRTSAVDDDAPTVRSPEDSRSMRGMHSVKKPVPEAAFADTVMETTPDGAAGSGQSLFAPPRNAVYVSEMSVPVAVTVSAAVPTPQLSS